MIKCGKDRNEFQMLQEMEKNILWFEKCSWLQQWNQQHSWERITWTIVNPLWTQKISHLKQMFDISTRLVSEQDEISGLETNGWENHSWKNLSSLGAERVINLQRTKVYPQILVPVRPQHRHRRTRQVHLQVQQQSEDPAPGNWRDSPKTQDKKKRRDNNQASEDRWRYLPEWLVEFTENLEDAQVPAPAHASHDSDSERPTKAASRKHSIETHFPKDRNCEVCSRTKITRAPCKRRAGEAVPRAVKFGDLITADYKIHSEECESRNNHRYAVVVQD